MKTLKPTKNPPINHYVHHADIYREIDSLKKDEWLPIECDNTLKAKAIRSTIYGRYRKLGVSLNTSVVNRILYVRVAP